MAKVTTNINLDEDLKKKAKELFANLGLDMTTAITMFLKQSIRENGFPFKPTMEVDTSKGEETNE